MVKIALLIGISQYHPDLTSLPGVEEDIKAMQRVLQNQNICGFDEVKTLLNCDRQTIVDEIEQLFSHSEKEDLLLLYFSGHGIKDEYGQLYFATSITRKDERGKLRKATAVEASFVQKIMSNSRSKRQVVILDCCFSGAFAEGLPSKDDGLVDIKNQLGGEGRAILTSSTSAQYSLDSIYTRYLVKGLETGLADIDNDGKISVEELHEYTKQQVQEAAPAMKPEIYPIKEGFKIILAQVRNNPELIYRQTVERLCAKGEISDTGRLILNTRRDTLEILESRAKEIEEEVLLPFKTYTKKLHKYEEVYSKAINSKNPLSEDTRNELKELQQILGLRDEDIIPIEDAINARFNSQKSHYIKYLKSLFICIIGVTVGVFVGYMVRPPLQTCANKEQYVLNDRISLGEEILLKQVTKSDKEAGVQAFAKGDCLTAIYQFESYRKTNPTDPEALIYLNNAKARQKGDQIKIAVSVPIGTTQSVAEEILRGAAQAQNEVNKSDGINGKLLEMAIANDNNDPTDAVQMANQFVKDTKILAVVGHNASNASIPAAYVYQKNGLVMMSPTSFAQNLSNTGNYIFRTVPDVSGMAEKLSYYAVNTARKTNILICVDSKAVDNQSFKDELIKHITSAGGKINPTNCDVSSPDFNPSAVISQAINSRADGLVLGLYIDKIKKGLAVVQANKGQLALFSSPTLYTSETLKVGKANIDGMIVAAPWHSAAFPHNPFLQKSQNLWRASVNWRTATAYDATNAIIAGLQQNITRDGLPQVLHSRNFAVDGATGKIQFSQNGDRMNNPIFLVKVKQKPGKNEYEFVPVQP
ncbi:extracellular ligand-binding receptor [Tolypothrix tenuis PCC 7101]|uniref:Extracellular ligand-binding receptor n=1 Tax=Tolypothrix tenuis PCC 7101 TaxID=231146 RepID=A0A1Z4MYK2_9CYAN|nr:ABC transporter substrate-binding protein [Aulosira sp. FACHB-113]BAY98523.1 extracellular ligand-binding receptor [Tolypothrix tenuis PCC 7101]BAZ77558.1 extracellular ligand-binding receptor [Aulosira laxa NIES-50]